MTSYWRHSLYAWVSIGILGVDVSSEIHIHFSLTAYRYGLPHLLWGVLRGFVRTDPCRIFPSPPYATTIHSNNCALLQKLSAPHNKTEEWTVVCGIILYGSMRYCGLILFLIRAATHLSLMWRVSMGGGNCLSSAMRLLICPLYYEKNQKAFLCRNLSGYHRLTKTD